jgi:myo-inositol-1(or 4)-monophosphatase
MPEPTPPDVTSPPDPHAAQALAAHEELAVELARFAGATIEASLGRRLAIRYKRGAEVADADEHRDPVSEVDEAVEREIRARLADRYPEHDVVGEEFDDRPNLGHSHVWAVDPVDGTTNFVNGLPLFSASVGLLIDGRPAVGALWCSTSHALHAGVYSARSGGVLHFDGAPIAREARPDLRRGLVGLPDTAGTLPYDVRKTGSAAIECAFVAAGLLAGARFETPNVWDVAGGLALAFSAGMGARVRRGGAWEALERIEGDPGAWRRPVALGTDAALDALTALP